MISIINCSSMHILYSKLISSWPLVSMKLITTWMQKNILVKYHSGFNWMHATKTTLFSVCIDMMMTSTFGQRSIGSGAFFLERPFSGLYICLIGCFLVSFINVVPPTAYLSSGVPQGSIFSPIHFSSNTLGQILDTLLNAF